MKQLYGEDAFQILPIEDGFIFATGQTAYDDKILVSYKMYSFETRAISPVTRSVFLLNKFGNNFKLFENEVKDFINCKVISLPERRTLIVHPTGDAVIYTSDMRILWRGKISYKDEAPRDVILYARSLWCSFINGNAIVRYSIQTMREELRIGGGNTPAFLAPCGLYMDNDTNLMVCNKGSLKIREINITSYMVQDYVCFDEPVYFYTKIKGIEIALLRSGIYLL